MRIYTTVNKIPEHKRNILNFGYGINFKYQGIFSHSFDRFYVVTNLFCQLLMILGYCQLLLIWNVVI